MPSRAIDASKYTGTVTSAVVDAWCSEAIERVILQWHPAGYGQERSLAIARTLAAHRCDRHPNGMPQDAYIYQYMADVGWTIGALATGSLLAAEGIVPHQLWLDAEDVSAGIAVWSVEQHAAAIRRDLALCDEWSGAYGLERAGIYTAAWWWLPRMGNSTEFADRELWVAYYDDQLNLVFVWFGGWSSCRIKQYRGTSTDVVGGLDMDLMSDEEAAEQAAIGEDDLPIPQDYKDKFGADVTWQGVADNLEGIVSQLQAELAAATQPDPKAQAAVALTERLRGLLQEVLA